MTFTGADLNVAQNPHLEINENLVSSPLSPIPHLPHIMISYTQRSCTIEDRNTLTCIAPAVAGDTLSYRLILDDAPFPDEPDAELELMLRPNPTGFRLITESVAIGSTAFIQIEVNI